MKSGRSGNDCRARSTNRSVSDTICVRSSYHVFFPMERPCPRWSKRTTAYPAAFSFSTRYS